MHEDIGTDFGRDMFDASGALNRQKLGSLVFSAPQELQRLNGIIYSHLGAEIDARLARQRGARCAAVDGINMLQARAAGAKFIVSPGYNEDVVKHCIGIDLPVLPGTVTPSEVTAAENLGLKVTKFFPAAQYGGLNTIKALAAPFVGHRFMPTGGVSTANVEEYLSSSAIIACGGTWMVKPALFADGDFSKVEQIAREAMDVVKKVRG